MVPVAGINGPANGFWAYATYNGMGWPTIIFDVSQIAQLPRIVWRFVYFHECAHLTIPTSNEVTANCEALKQMRAEGEIDDRGERTVQRLMESLPTLPPQYGGSGRAFWRATMECVEGEGSDE